MRILKLRLEGGHEEVVLSSDSQISCVRKPDEIITGDLCYYPNEKVVAKVIEIFDFNFDTNSSVPDFISKQTKSLNDDLQKAILNDLKTENEKRSSNTPESSNARTTSRAESDLPSNIGSKDSSKSQSPGQKKLLPNNMKVKTGSGDELIKELNVNELSSLLEKKWTVMRIPDKLNITDAVKCLKEPCLEAFNKLQPETFMFKISCYLFHLDVLRIAYLDPPKIMNKKKQPPRYNKKRLNIEAQDAFYFLANYFSTILYNDSDEEYECWLLAVRNKFNATVEGNKNDSKQDDNIVFENHVIEDHVPIFNKDNAF